MRSGSQNGLQADRRRVGRGFAWRNIGLIARRASRAARRRAIIACVVRKAFRMEIHPGCHAEYARRHQPIWQELEEALIQHGVRSYSIYVDPVTTDLFGYLECDNEAAWHAVAATDVCQRWWRFMREVMPTNRDDSPVSRELREVFHLEAPRA